MAQSSLMTTQAPATQVNPQHDHCAVVDEKGNGTTTVSANHYHIVAAGRVMPDPRDGHYHNIQPVTCAQPAPPPQAGGGCGTCGKNR